MSENGHETFFSFWRECEESCASNNKPQICAAEKLLQIIELCKLPKKKKTKNNNKNKIQINYNNFNAYKKKVE